MNRDKRIAEMMGIEYAGEHWPDVTNFSAPYWKSKLMDFCIEQGWWREFFWIARHKFWSSRVGIFVQFDEPEFAKYLWRNLATLVDEYTKEKER